jgi:predicted transposase YdaD
MKTDSLFYKLFQQAPQLVLELAGMEQASTENYQFRSEEIKQTALLVYKFPKLSREEIQQMLGYNDISLKETRFYQDVYAEGQQEGEQKGLQKGQQEGEAKLILRQLTRRFGVLGEDTQNRVKHLNIMQLEALGEALLDFSTQDDVERWLEK